MTELTQKQREILEAILNIYESTSKSPTIRQLCSLTSCKRPSAMYKHVLALEKKGVIERRKHKWFDIHKIYPLKDSNDVY